MLLQDNLQELYYAVHHTTATSLPLVSNFSGTRLYYSGSGWGRLWIWLHRVVDWISQKNYRLESLTKALIHTHQLFQRQLALVLPSVKRYYAALEKKSQGFPVDECSLKQGKKEIVAWIQATAPFVKMMQKPLPDRLSKLFYHVFGSGFSAAYIHPPKLDCCQKVIAFEAVGEELPWEAFCRVIQGKQLQASFDGEIDKWVKRVNKLSNIVKPLCKALEALAVISGQESERVGLEVFLERRGCKVFQQTDPKQAMWRDQLKKGFKVVSGDKILVLGEEMLSSKLDGNSTRVFAVEGVTDQLFLVGQNREVMAMRQWKHRQSNKDGVAVADLVEVSPDRRYALMEKLFPICSDHCDQVIEMIKELITNDWMPHPFSFDSMMVDGRGVIKSVLPITKKKFSFHAVEDFLISCFGGNLELMQQVVNSCGMRQHPMVKFYREVVVNTLKGDTLAIEDLAGIYKIGDGSVVVRGEALAKAIKQLKHQKMVVLRSQHPEMELKVVEKQVEEMLLQEYDRGPVFSIC